MGAFAPCLLICLVLLSVITAKAQQVYGTIDGNVTDSSGAAIPGASVTVRETNKGVVFTSKTNASGFYAQGQLIPGIYVVTIEVPHFKKAVSGELTVNVDQVTRFDAALTVGDSNETVEVTSNAPLLQTDRADLATTLTADQVLNLPE